jgi:UDP-GlcNAc3NAcA epimerase
MISPTSALPSRPFTGNVRIASIVGARPQFVKLAVMDRVFASYPGVEHRIIHTGQHYDDAMSGSFFRDLAIADPAHNLEVGSGLHGEQTATMIARLEPVLLAERPDWVLLYGDTNSTVAGALTAAKLHIPIAHIEAGLRSFNRAMPEEVNRIVADHLSDALLCPTQASMENLRREGLEGRTVLTGDIMYDAVLANISAAEERDRDDTRWPAGSYALATIHRAENTDDPVRLRALLAALESIAAEVVPVVLALHPRTRKLIEDCHWRPERVTVIPPAPYMDMLLLEKRARMILTDSGGVQKEAYFLRVPCLTLREETEWVETLGNSCNVLVGASDPQRIRAAAHDIDRAGPWSDHYGQGDAGFKIAAALMGASHDRMQDRVEFESLTALERATQPA